RKRVNSENLKNTRDQQRIEWRFPCCRSGLWAEWTTEAFSGGKRASNAAHLPSETKIVIMVVELVSMAKENQTETQSESDYRNPEGRGSERGPLISGPRHCIRYITCVHSPQIPVHHSLSVAVISQWNL